jgi:hypothetical protein
MAIYNGSDVTQDADLTSDLADLEGAPDYSDSLSSNNGNNPQKPGTRLVGSDGVQPQGQQTAKVAPPAAATEAKAPSVRDAITAAIKGEPDAQGRVRNPDGTFAPKPADAPAQAAPAATDAPAAQAVAPIQAPAQMSAAEATLFAQLPAEMQQYVARTMEGVERTVGQSREFADINAVLEPRRQALAMNGMTTAQYVHQITSLADFADNDPIGFMNWFAGQRGIDPSTILADAPQVDPAVAAMQQEIATLRQQVGGFQQTQTQAAHNNLVSEVANFASQIGGDGNPLRPHWDELGDAVLPHIQAVKAQNPGMSNADVLASAYETACWAHPSVRTKMLAAEQAKQLAQQRAHAGRAAAAGSSVVGAPGGGTPASTDYGDGSIRSIIAAQLARG